MIGNKTVVEVFNQCKKNEPDFSENLYCSLRAIHLSVHGSLTVKENVKFIL